MAKKTKEANFTQRVLMSLVVDMQAHVETADRLRIQIEALAKENDVTIPTRE